MGTAYTSQTGGGNRSWSDPANWTPNGVPAAGDTATIASGSTVVVPDGYAAVVGSSPATGGAAALTINGTLTVGQTDGAASPASLRVLGPVNLATTLVTTFKAGTSLAFDATGAADPANTKYAWTVNYQARLVFNGTAAARCSVSSAAGGGNGYFTGSGSQTGQVQASYTDFARVGDATNPLVMCTPGPAPGGLLLLNCTADSCGWPRTNDNGGNAVVRFEGNRFTNSAAAASVYIAGTSALTTGTRTYLGNATDKIVNFYGPQDFTVQRNYFGGGWSVSGNYKWADFSDNFAYTPNNVNGGPNWQISGNVKRVYLYVEGGVNPHFCKPNNSVGNVVMDGLIFEYGGTSADGDDFNFEAPAAVTTYTLRNSIKLPNAAGLSSGTLFSGLGNGNCRMVCEHNTIHGGGGGDSSGGRVGETFPSFAGQVQSMRGNLFWDTTPRGFVFYDMSASPAVDAVTAANCDYNGQFNATSGTCTVNGGSVSVLGYRGLNVSGTTNPGAHDVVADPRFVDPGRCLRAWDASLGGPGTAVKALERLANNPTLVPVLIAWVQAGFVPTNPAFVAPAGGGLAFPGDTATTDAAGNPLLGTLGAMAYQSAAATSYTLAGPSSGKVGVASTNFTVTPNGSYTGTITPSDGGAGGAFTPASLTWSGDSSAKTFTYTPSTGGARTVATTNSVGLPDPAGVPYTATAAAYALTGPTAGTVGQASAPFTVTPNGPYTGSVTPSDGGAGGTFSPTSLAFTGSAAPQTFTYTAATAGNKSVSTSSSPALTDPAPIAYTASNAVPNTGGGGVLWV